MTNTAPANSAPDPDQASSGAQPQDAAQPQRRRWLWAVATVSLALNLVVVGFIAGQMLRRGGFERHGPHGYDHLRRIVLEDVADADRKRVEAILDRRRADIRANRRARRAAFRRVGEAMRADPVDDGELRTAFDALLEVDNTARRTMANTATELAPYLSQRLRARIVRRLRRGMRRRGPG